VRLVALVFAALVLAAPAVASERHPTLGDLENQVMCPVCYPETIGQSSSPAAQRIKQFIQRRIDAGDTKSEIEGFGYSVSSIQWRKSPGAYIRPGGDTFSVTINDAGSGFVFEVSGAYQYCETRQGSYLCRVANQDRKWRAFREPGAGAQ